MLINILEGSAQLFYIFLYIYKKIKKEPLKQYHPKD